MSRQDLIMCLKNALERGSDLEQAKRSLISAGYSPSEVNLAAQELEGKISLKKGEVPKTGFFPKLPQPPKR